MNTTRRTLIGAAIPIAADALAPFVRPAGAAAPHPDATLLALRQRHVAANAELDRVNLVHCPIEDAFFKWLKEHPDADRAVVERETGLDKANAAQRAAVRAINQTVDEIAAIPARTLDGIRIKAQVSAQELNMEEHLLSSIVADLLRGDLS